MVETCDPQTMAGGSPDPTCPWWCSGLPNRSHEWAPDGHDGHASRLHTRQVGFFGVSQMEWREPDGRRQLDHVIEGDSTLWTFEGSTDAVALIDELAMIAAIMREIESGVVR